MSRKYGSIHVGVEENFVHISINFGENKRECLQTYYKLIKLVVTWKIIASNEMRCLLF
jgi:hypothetical protein